MDTSTANTSERALMREMGITGANIERRLRYVAFEAGDAERIAKVRSMVEQHVDQLTESFFKALGDLEDSRPLLQNQSLFELAKRLKREHLLAMVHGPYDGAYVEQRLRLAVVYNKAGLGIAVFLGAFNRLLETVGEKVMSSDHPGNADERHRDYMSLHKIALFDVSLIVDSLIFERERLIHRQQDAIQELSTPVLQLRDRMLLVPLIGVVDTFRARQLTEGLLQGIRDTRAKVVVMDITGVAAVDSKVANHLSQTVAAAKLMGATVIVSGIASDVANALVTVGVDVNRFNTVGDLQAGIEESERLLGLRVVKDERK